MNLKTLLASLICSSQLSFQFELEDIKSAMFFGLAQDSKFLRLNNFAFVFDIQQNPLFASSFMPFVIGHSEIRFDALPRFVWFSVSPYKSSTQS